MITGKDQRSWADICPDFLEPIYSRLTSHVDGTHFGGVCKNWHQVHSQVALSNPLPVVIIPAKFSSSDVIEVREDRMFLQRRRESQIPEGLAGADITILGRVGAWFLVRVHRGLQFYNPLLQKPKSYIYLPGKSFRFSDFRRDPTPLPISFAFSGLPTARNMMILMVYGDRFFNAFSPKNQKVETYDFSLGGKKGQLCIGVGYKNGRFFCLFEMGDMLIFSVDENETRMLLGATKPLLPEQLQMCDNLSVVAVVAAKMNATTTTDEVGELLGFTVVTHWERDHEASEQDIFRLVAVEENAMTTTELLENDYYEIASLEDGDNNRGVILVRDLLPLKRNVDGYYMIIMIVSLGIVVFLGVALLGISSSSG